LHGQKVADITLEILGGDIRDNVDVSPLSHMDRRPWGAGWYSRSHTDVGRRPMERVAAWS